MNAAVRGILLAAVACLGGPATAGEITGDTEPEAVAQQHVARAMAEIDGGDLPAALQDFRRAFALVPNPRFLFNMAQIERRLGQRGDAIEHYERFLAGIEPVASDADLTRRIKIAGEALSALRAERPHDEAAGPAATRAEAPPALAPAAQLAPPAPAPARTALPPPPPAADVPGRATGARPLYKRGYFWAGVAAVVLGAALGATAYMTSRPPDCPTGAICTHP
jgi:tetratricopeptide (TPR) repeat protein